MSNQKTKHTPGPWKTEIHVKDIEIWNQNTHIATINHHYKYEDQPAIDKANARLIAAAPELLEALIAAVAQLDRDGHDLSKLGFLKQTITKATGGAE